MKLDNWSVGSHKADSFLPPELKRPCLHGILTGHPKHADGTEVTTSAIIGVEGDYIKTSSGSLYELGTVDPQYEQLEPNARERLFTQWRRPNAK